MHCSEASQSQRYDDGQKRVTLGHQNRLCPSQLTPFYPRQLADARSMTRSLCEVSTEQNKIESRIHTLLLTNNPGLFQDFPGSLGTIFQSPRMSKYKEKYKEKTAFTHNIESVVECRKFSIKQNVDVSC